MSVTVRKANLKKALLCCGGFLCAACVFHALTGLPSVSVFSAAEGPAVTVVIDPGHGGEDGGAVSVDEQMELAMRFQVFSIPMLVVFKDGKAVAKSVGYRPKSEITAMVEGVR